MTADEKRAALDEITRAMAGLSATRLAILAEPGPAPDETTDLIRAIGSATIPVGNGGLVCVAVCTTIPASYSEFAGLVESQGVALIDGRQGKRSTHLKNKTAVFFDVKKVCRYLLRRTSWTELDCESLLRKVPGVTREQRTVSGRRIWGIEIPMAEWVAVQAGARAADIPTAVRRWGDGCRGVSFAPADFDSSR